MGTAVGDSHDDNDDDDDDDDDADEFPKRANA
jgi:hypothetical protein